MRKPCFTRFEYLMLGFLTFTAVGTGVGFARLLDAGFPYLSIVALLVSVAATFIGGIGWWVLLCQVFERTTPVEDSFAVFVPPTGPRITSVSYRRLRSFGSYENEAVEVTAEVRAGENPEKVYGQLVLWVADRLGVSAELRDQWAERDKVAAEKANLERDVARLRDKYEKAKEFLEKCKIDPNDEIPF